MKKEIVIILSIIFFVLFISIVASAIYINLDIDSNSDRVRINKNILGYNLEISDYKTNENICESKNCFVYPKVDQSISKTSFKIPEQNRNEVCNKPKVIECKEGCLQPLKQEKGSGHFEIPIQTKKSCENRIY